MLGEKHSTSTWAVVWFVFFYHFCEQIRFLSLLEMGAVFSMNNNNTCHLSSACVPGIVLSTTQPQLTCSHFEVWCDDVFLSFMSQHHLLIYKNSVTTLLWFWPLWNRLCLTGITSSILQMHTLNLREAEFFAPVHTACRRQRRLTPGPQPVFLLLHHTRPRPIPHREGSRHFYIRILCAWRFLGQM